MRRTAITRTLATLAIVALFGGVSAAAASTAGAATGSTPTLRASVDTVGARFFAAKAAARTLDEKLRTLDHTLAVTRRRVEALHPMAKATAVQLYQGSSQGFTTVFDATDAMESARRAELLARVGDHTQAVLDRYMNAADILERQRTTVAQAREKQAKVVADLAKQEAVLQRLLAQAQQAYRNRLAAEARASASASPTSNRSEAATAPPTAAPTAPPAPIQTPPPAPPESGANPHHDDPFLVCTRTRESSGNYRASNPAGYYGAYQFSQPTWDVTASHAGSPQLIGVRPDLASPWDQDQLAWVLYQWQGRGPWLGLC